MIKIAGMRNSPRYAIGLDVGGTKIAGGVITASGELVERMPPVSSMSSQRDGTVTRLCAAVDHLRSQHPSIEAIGVGAAGLVDWPDGRIRWAPNNAYRDLPLRQLLHEATGLATVVDNDANTAAWAEARLGQHVATYLAFLTIGTGVGGGLILDGRLFRGKTGIGAEVGHLVVDANSPERCGCGNNGCLEALTSGTALGRFGREAAAADPQGMLRALAGDVPTAVTGETVLEAARAGDPTAIALFQRLGRWLGIGIATLVNLYDLELIVLGGGVTAAAGDLLVVPAQASFLQHVFAPTFRKLPDIVPARLGNDAGWIGAALQALDQTVGSSAADIEKANEGELAATTQH